MSGPYWGSATSLEECAEEWKAAYKRNLNKVAGELTGDELAQVLRVAMDLVRDRKVVVGDLPREEVMGDD